MVAMKELRGSRLSPYPVRRVSRNREREPKKQYLQFAALTERVCFMVCRYWAARGWQPDHDTAEECLQEARLSVWRALEKVEAMPDEESAAYAAVCARRAATRHLRREMAFWSRVRSLKSPLEESLDFSYANTAVEVAGTTERWLERFIHHELAERIMALPPRDRSILYLYYAHGMTDAEVAHDLHCSVSAIEQQRRRLLVRLRRSLTPQMGG
jgi:RNA polymerase sigma factor (sigma-70 family)